MAQNEKKKKSSIRYMILSVIAAIAIWSLISYSNNPEISKTFHNIKISFTGETELKKNGYVVINKANIPELSVKVSGKRGDLIQALGNVKLNIDVSDISDSGNYDLTGLMVMPGPRLTIDKQNFSTVPVTIDEYISKEIPVEVRKTGDSGVFIESVPVHETIVIHGAKSELENISSAFVSIDEVEVKASGEISKPVLLADNDGRSIKKPETVDMDEFILVKNTLYEPRTVPVTAKLSAELGVYAALDEAATSINPSSVEVGVLPGSDISFVTAIVTDLSGDEAECELESVQGLYIPDSVKRVKVKPVLKNEEY